jgi:hypothetical protein
MGSHLRHPSNPTHFSSQEGMSNPNIIRPFIPSNNTPAKTSQYPGEEVLFSFANEERENEAEIYTAVQPD